MNEYLKTHLWMVIPIALITAAIYSFLEAMVMAKLRRYVETLEFENDELKSIFMKPFLKPISQTLMGSFLWLAFLALVFGGSILAKASPWFVLWFFGYCWVPMVVIIIEDVYRLTSLMYANTSFPKYGRIDKDLVNHLKKNPDSHIFLYKAGWLTLLLFVMHPSFFMAGAALGLFAFGMKFKSIGRKSLGRTRANEKPSDLKPLKCPECGKTYDKTWKVCFDCKVQLLEPGNS